ncbi:MAG TPA: hypothetical protein VHE13_02515 [Opitutus sp.]|nr:hypothetical protein [Opitutus sp.]
MAKKKTRPVSERDLTLRPAGEAVRRLLFLVYVLGGAAGFVALGAGIAKHRPVPAAAGAAGLLVAVVLHFTRGRWGAQAVLGEVKTNPFKPRRVPRDDEDEAPED